MPHDATSFYQLNSNPDVMRLTGDALTGSVDDAREAISNYTDFDKIGFGRWACILKESMQIIGFCGLKYLSEFDEVDVGYRFLPEHWGHGLATEACLASLQFGFEMLDLPQIIGLVLPENLASIRVMEKAGMSQEATVETGGLTAFQYSVTREQFLARLRNH